MALSNPSTVLVVLCFSIALTAQGFSYDSPTINPSEYKCAHRLLDGDLEFYWNLVENDSIVDFALRVKTLGWVGFGTNSQDGEMTGADIMMAYVKDGTAYAQDMYSRSNGQPSYDVNVGGTNDLITVVGEEVDGWTSIRFARNMKSSDKYDTDYTLFADGMRVIFAFHPSSDSFTAEHDDDDTVDRDIVLGTCLMQKHGDDDDDDDEGDFMDGELIHAALMMFSWGFLVPGSIMIAKYLKNIGHMWYQLHVALMLVAVVCTVIGFALMASHEEVGESTHGVFGTMVLVLMLIQPALGFYADKVYNPRRTEIPFWPDKVHWHIGRVCFLFSIITVFLGTAKLEGGNFSWILFYVLLLGTWIAASIYINSQNKQPRAATIEMTSVADSPTPANHGGVLLSSDETSQPANEE